MRRIATSIALLAASLPWSAAAQSTTPIQRIRANPQGYLNQTVSVEGKVARYVDAVGDQYYFEDDYGTQIRVVTQAARPPIETRCIVTGTVAIDPTGDPYVVQSGGCGGTAAAADADGDGVPDALDHCPGTLPGTRVDASGCPVTDRTPVYVGLGLGALLIVGFATYRFTGRPVPNMATVPTAPVAPEPHATSGNDDYFKGATIRFTRPTSEDGTLKLVPGRLEVVGGPDKGNEIRFVHVNAGVPEVTFGRSEGPKYTHIQLTAPTVSRRHAIMRFEGGKWAMANFSETNPVVINGEALTAIGSPRALQDGDTLEFGEVTLKFHSH